MVIDCDPLEGPGGPSDRTRLGFSVYFSALKYSQCQAIMLQSGLSHGTKKRRLKCERETQRRRGEEEEDTKGAAG